MTNREEEYRAQDARIGEASAWFARMKAPDAADEKDAFDQWLADPQNAAAFAQIEKVWSIAGRARPRPIERLGQQPGQRHRWRLAALAAALIGCVTLAAALQMGPAADRSGETSRYAAPVGTIRTVSLTDGSTVTLDTDSRIVVRMTSALREVSLLAGRARFAVAHDARRPFVVLAGNRAIVATGTLFDVRLRQSYVEVTLIEGGVDLERRDRGQAPVRLGHLRPGEKAVLDHRARARSERAPAGAATWTSGLLTADGLTLGEVVAEANRYGTRPIALEKASLGQLRISGAFAPGDTEALAAQLAAALDLRAVRRPDGAIMLTAPASDLRQSEKFFRQGF